MRSLFLLPIAAFAAGCTAAQDTTTEPDAAASASLTAALEGRTSGTPVSCINQRSLGSSRVIDENTILFGASGGTIYVNRTRNSCPGARTWDAIRTRGTSSSLCEGELVAFFDPRSGIESGGCTLGQFTPYRRAR